MVAFSSFLYNLHKHTWELFLWTKKIFKQTEGALTSPFPAQMTNVRPVGLTANWSWYSFSSTSDLSQLWVPKELLPFVLNSALRKIYLLFLWQHISSSLKSWSVSQILPSLIIPTLAIVSYMKTLLGRIFAEINLKIQLLIGEEWK